MERYKSAGANKRHMPSRAQLFTLDLLLALIPLTIVLGISANAMGGVVTQIQEYVVGYSIQRAANDAADALAKTAGVPVNWNSTEPPTVPGIAYYDPSKNDTVSMLLDESKVAVLNVTHIGQLLGNRYPYYNLTVRGLENSSLRINICNGTKTSVTDLVVVERNLLYYVVKVMAELHQIAHGDKEVSERCCTTCSANQYLYELAFTIKADERSNFNYWIGYASDGGVNAEYTVREIQVNCCDKCSNLGSPKQDLFSSSFGNSGKEWGTANIGLDFPGSLVVGTNYVYIRATGSPNVNGADFYVMKAPLNTSQSDVTEYAALKEPQAIRLTLEVGR